MGLIGLVSPRLILALIVAIVLAFSHGAAYRAGGKSVQNKWNVEKLELATAATKAAEDARAREQSLTAKVSKIRSVKDAEIEKLRTDLELANSELRQRPERPADYLPQDAGTGQRASCSADQLYREDAESLTRIAGDAEQVRIAYRQCKAQYNAAADSLK